MLAAARTMATGNLSSALRMLDHHARLVHLGVAPEDAEMASSLARFAQGRYCMLQPHTDLGTLQEIRSHIGPTQVMSGRR